MARPYAWPVTESPETAAEVRPGRCATHPDVASVGACERCGRALCVACATPVRGRLIGAECISAILEDVPRVERLPPPIPRRGDLLAGIGFLLALLVSALPWSRGEFSGLFGAWSVNWSGLAVLASAAGVVVATLAWFRRWRPAWSAGLYAALAVGVGGGAILHVVTPPLLSDPSPVPALAVIGAAVALAGGLLKSTDVMRARHPAI